MDIYDDSLIRLGGFEKEKNPAFTKLYKNSVVSERFNHNKNTFYKMDLIIGKLNIMNFPTMNKEE